MNALALDTAAQGRPYKVKVNGQDTGKIAHVTRMKVAAIKGDPEYQRDISKEWVRKNGPWNEQKAGTVVLSSRAGGPYCIDGQHRIELARQDGVESVLAFVIDGLTKAEEAALFVEFQRTRRSLTSWALWRAELAAGNPEAVAIEKVVLGAGFRLAREGGTAKTIQAVDGCRRVFRIGGAVLLHETLSLIADGLWVGEVRALSGQLISGLGLFLDGTRDDPNWSRERLVKVMRINAPSKVLMRSQGIAITRESHASVGIGSVAQAFHETYNGGLARGSRLAPLTIGGRKRPAPRRQKELTK